VADETPADAKYGSLPEADSRDRQHLAAFRQDSQEFGSGIAEANPRSREYGVVLH
jgi:hypothetical protein